MTYREMLSYGHAVLGLTEKQLKLDINDLRRLILNKPPNFASLPLLPRASSCASRSRSSEELALSKLWHANLVKPIPFIEKIDQSSSQTEFCASDCGETEEKKATSPPNAEHVWKHIDRVFTGPKKTVWCGEIKICSLNIFHYSRILNPGPCWSITCSFADFLHCNYIQFMCIQDTKLRCSQLGHVKEAFFEQGFDVFATNPDSPFGCLIAARKEFHVRRITRLSSTIGMDIMLAKERRMRIICTYWSPHHDAPTHISAKRDALRDHQEATALSLPAVLLGDPNRRSCPRSFREALGRGLRDVKPPQPTVVQPGGTSFADAILVSDELLPAVSEPCVYLDNPHFSDCHLPFSVQINVKAIRTLAAAFSLRRLMVTQKDVDEITKRANARAEKPTPPHQLLQCNVGYYTKYFFKIGVVSSALIILGIRLYSDRDY